MPQKRTRKRRRLSAVIIIAAAVLAVAAALVVLAFVRPFGLDVFHTAPTPEPVLTAAPANTPEPTEQTPQSTTEPAAATPQAAYRRSLYEASLDIDPKSMRVDGRLRLTYVCECDGPLYSLELNLYPNAISYGCLKVNAVSLNGEDAYFSFYNNDTVLIVPFVNELYRGESAVVYIDYSIELPETFDRFGYGGDEIMLGHSLPIASVYEEGEWRRENYTAIGDSFLNAMADYKVLVTLPQEWSMLSCGKVMEETTENGVTTYLVEAPQVREFALGAQKNARIATVTSADGVEIVCLAANDAQARFGADTAKKALEFFSEKIGSYPYSRFCVVQFGFAGGMEYPGLVMVYDKLFSKNQDIGEYIIAHETAHQWFYSAIGSDAVREPWLDESLTEFMTQEYLRLCTSAELYDTTLAENDAYLDGYERTQRLDASLGEFAYSAEDYDNVVYRYGSYVYRKLMEKIGEESFYSALADYYINFRFKTASAPDLISAFSQAAGEDLSGWFESMAAVKP